MVKAKKASAVAKKTSVPLVSVEAVEQELDVVLQRMALVISKVTDAQQGEALLMVRSAGRAIEDTETVLKQRIVDFLTKNGVQTTEKGTLQASVGGFRLEVQPTRTGADPKKVEGLLRAKGLDPSLGMDAKVSYVPNDGKLADAVRNGKLTEDELASCQYALSYRLITPKREE